MKVVARAASLSSLVALTALLGLSIFEGVGAARGTWRVVPVLSGSMAPNLPTGSAVVAWRTSLKDLHVGDVVAYAIPVDDHHVEMHRVVSLKRVAGDAVIKTKGDANNGVDPWTAKLTGSTFWRVGLDVPYLGWPIVYLQRPLVRLAATLVAALVFLLSSRRRARRDDVAVVPVETAEAIVGALEQELAEERGRLRADLDGLVRRVADLQDEDRHRRRMRDVEELLADLRSVQSVVEAVEQESSDAAEVPVLDTIESPYFLAAGATGRAA